jgi:signal peptidase II
MLAGIGVGSAVGAFALDAVTKQHVRDSMYVDETHRVAPGIGYGHIENPASSWGLPVVGAAGAVGIAAGLAGLGVWAGMGKGPLPRVALAGAGLVLGGAIGNLVDRSSDGTVTDMFHVTNMFNYFNVADLALTAGIGLTGIAAVAKIVRTA